jgi:molecular chaperone DnaK
MIFQTEKQLKEFGEKLSEGNKTAINQSTGEIKRSSQEPGSYRD